MTPDEAYAHLDDAIKYLPQESKDVVAIRALLAGYEAAVKDLYLTRSCINCKHVPGAPFDEGACKDCAVESNWSWRGPEPGGEDK
jgi:hypothetical protein